MRLRVTIRPKTGEMLLTKNYMRQLTSAIWKSLDCPEEKDSRLPKLIAFSPLLFKDRKIEGNKIRFKGTFGQFLVSTPTKLLLEKLSDISGMEMEIGGNVVNVGRVEFEDGVNFDEKMCWQTFPGAGICTKKPSLEKTETYIFPNRDGNQLCQESLTNTLKTRWKTLCQKDSSKAILWCDSANPLDWAEENLPHLTIVVASGMRKEKIKESANFMSWDGKVLVEGHTAWQRLVWDCGLGIKTGVGCGMVEPLKESPV